MWIIGRLFFVFFSNRHTGQNGGVVAFVAVDSDIFILSLMAPKAWKRASFDVDGKAKYPISLRVPVVSLPTVAIEVVAKSVAVHGPGEEQRLEREGVVDFGFLRPTHPLHHVYLGNVDGAKVSPSPVGCLPTTRDPLRSC